LPDGTRLRASGKTPAPSTRRATGRESLLQKELHTHRAFDSEQAGPNEKAPTGSALVEPGNGLEPSTPSRGIGRL